MSKNSIYKDSRVVCLCPLDGVIDIISKKVGAFDKKWDRESQQDPIQRITKGIWSYQPNSNTTGLILFQQQGNIVYGF
jgi:hypothetical protein